MKKLVLTLFFCIIFFNGFSQSTIIAHRGASYLAPENTLSALHKAWDSGADASEIDVRLTKDKKVILSHDDGTMRTTGQPLLVKESDSKALRKLDAGSWKSSEFTGEKLPFLNEAIRTIPEGKELFIEIKCGTEILPSLAKDCRKSGKSDQLIFISFNWDVITGVKELFPDNKCYWLCSDKDLLDEKFTAVKERNLDGVDLRYSIINEEVMEQANKLGLEVYAWTIDDPDTARKLTKLGVIGITTNRPAWLREQIRNP